MRFGENLLKRITCLKRFTFFYHFPAYSLDDIFQVKDQPVFLWFFQVDAIRAVQLKEFIFM